MLGNSDNKGITLLILVFRSSKVMTIITRKPGSYRRETAYKMMNQKEYVFVKPKSSNSPVSDATENMLFLQAKPCESEDF